jgi:hypothetical protein
LSDFTVEEVNHMRRTLGIVILSGMILSFFLAAIEVPVTAQVPTGKTPTIAPETPTPTATPQPVPFGGHLSTVDRGAVLRATFGPLMAPLAALVMLIGIIGVVVNRRPPTA